MSRKEKKYHYLYKTTNLLNGKYYYGIHSTYKLDDSYLGSGTYLRRAIRKYGKENFKREILEFFENRELLIKGEEEFITKEIVCESKCMNLCKGGHASLIGMVSVKDSKGNTFSVFNDDHRWLSGELVHVTKGKATVKDKDGKSFNVSVDDLRYLSGELNGVNIGKSAVKDKDGKKFSVFNDDPRRLSGELVSVNKGMIIVKDSEDNRLQVSVNDLRYLSGELLYNWTGRKHKEESKNKIGLANKIRQKGPKNSQYGTCWITKDDTNKKIKKEDIPLFIKDGWVKGRV